VVSCLIAFTVAQFTKDVETIVVSSLAGIWIAEVILYIVRCKIIFNKRMKTLDGSETFEIIRKKKNFIKSYIIFSITFAITFGFVLYQLKDNIVNNIVGGQNSYQVTSVDGNLLIIKIAVVIILLIALFIRLAVRMRYKKQNVGYIK